MCAQFEGPLADSAVQVFLEMSMCKSVNSSCNVGKMLLTFLDASHRRTHRANCESQQHISSKQNEKKAITAAGNERTYLRRN